jgi:hypothetical protein
MREATEEGEPFATATARDLAEAYTHLGERARRILFRQQFVDFLPRRLPHMHQAEDFGLTMPVRIFTKTGGGMLSCIDSGLFETDGASWVAAAMAKDQPDFAMRPDDSAPTAFALIGELLHDAWAR